MSGGALDSKLREFCTSDRQREYFDAVVSEGTVGAAERKLGVSPDLIGRFVRKLKEDAARKGFAPNHFESGVADGFLLKHIKIHRDADGNVKQSWECQVAGGDLTNRIEDFIQHLAERNHIARKTVPLSPAHVDDDLLAVYPMGDPHVGMIAYAEESGDDFNLETCVADLKEAFAQLIASAPPAKHALIAELGDFFHSDNEQNKTARSGNSLDADRWSKVQVAGLEVMIACIEMVAEKHENVTVRIVRGNHDTHSSYALSLMLAMYFRHTPRINVVISANAHWYYEFGKVLIGLTHGDTSKASDMPGIMASDMAEAWGRTMYRYWYHGHIHNKRMQEGYGALVESFRTLAGKDAWHSAEGYRSGQDMNMILHHREFGEIMRTRADIRLVRAMRAKRQAALMEAA